MGPRFRYQTDRSNPKLRCGAEAFQNWSAALSKKRRSVDLSAIIIHADALKFFTIGLSPIAWLGLVDLFNRLGRCVKV